MALWELDEFKPAQFLGFVRNLPAPEAYKGTRWLPNRTTSDLAFEYILGTNSTPVMAHIIGFDSEAPIAGRPGIGHKVSGELPPIKRKSMISEKEIIRFMAPRAGTVDVQDALNTVYADTAGLLDSVQARVEWLRMKALSEDTVTYADPAVPLPIEFDYGITQAFQVNLVTQLNGAGVDISSSVSTVWSDTASSNWVLDLQYLCDLIETTRGFRPVEFVCSRQALTYMLNNVAVRQMVRGSSAPAAVLTRAEIDLLIELYSLPTIVTYDVIVREETAAGTYTDVRPLAQNKAILIPPSTVTLGETLWGPTAEARVLYGTPLAQQAPGIWAETYGTTEPPSEWIKAVATAFPSMPGANILGQMTLFA